MKLSKCPTSEAYSLAEGTFIQGMERRTKEPDSVPDIGQ